MSDYGHIIDLKPCCLGCWEFDPNIESLLWQDGFDAQAISCKHIKVCEKWHHSTDRQISRILEDYISHKNPSLE